MPPANAIDLIRTAARLRSTLLLYWVGAREMVIWVVSADGAIHVRRVKVTPASLTALVRNTAPFAAASGGSRSPGAPVVLQQSSAAWRDLYGLLIAPVRALLPTSRGALLTIVPHEALLNLSFAALQNAIAGDGVATFARAFLYAGAASLHRERLGRRR